MEYRWITKINEFQEIAAQWDEALLLSKEDNPFLLSDFLLTWWKHYSQGLKLRIFILYRNTSIIGGLPLCQNRNGYLEYPGGITANYTEFLSHGEDHVFWKYFLESLNQLEAWRCIRLKRIRKKRVNIEQLNKIVSEQKDILLDLRQCEYSYLINIPSDFADYIQRMPKKLRYYIKRSEREFSKLGVISLCSLKSYDKISALLDTYINFSRNSFKKRKKQSAFEDRVYCIFFKELISKMHQAGCLDANALTLNNRIIAIHFGYSLGNNLNYIFPAFDIEFANLNPGHLMIYKLIELASKRKNKIFDFYTGYSFYKEQWCDQKDETVSVDIRPKCFRSKIEQGISRQINKSVIVKKSKEIIKSSPGMINLARKIKSLIQD